MGDGNAAFRMASNLKTAWLGITCQDYNPPPVRVTEEHKPPHHEKVATTWEGYFGYCKATLQTVEV